MSAPDDAADAIAALMLKTNALALIHDYLADPNRTWQKGFVVGTIECTEHNVRETLLTDNFSALHYLSLADCALSRAIATLLAMDLPSLRPLIEKAQAARDVLDLTDTHGAHE